MPLPQTDFDPTEAGVSWRILRDAGHTITFATPDGQAATADPRMTEGIGLGPFKRVLMAQEHGLDSYRRMIGSAEFRRPLRYQQVRDAGFAALVLTGGHAPGMKRYLESEELHSAVAEAMARGKPVGAICHGVVLAARAKDASGKSVLYGRKTTSLTNSMELSAWNMTRMWLGDYYRTYPATVQDEVTAALRSPSDYVAGPLSLLRDRPDRLSRGFVVHDGNYLSARWPGDAHRFATELAALLEDFEPERSVEEPQSEYTGRDQGRGRRARP